MEWELSGVLSAALIGFTALVVIFKWREKSRIEAGLRGSKRTARATMEKAENVSACGDCGGKVAPSAKSCPHCGSTRAIPRAAEPRWKMALVVWVVIGGGLYFWWIGWGQRIAEVQRIAPELANRVRARGYLCSEVTDFDRLEVDAMGNRIYKISCGYSGPYYRMTVRADGVQVLMPMGR